jgi:hypothetical protein
LSELFLFIVLYSPPISTLHHSSYDDGTRPRTIVYDNGTIQTWPPNETAHYLTYPSALSELTHQADQVHYWQDNGGTYIQYLGKIL